MIRGEVCGNLNSTSRNSSKLKISQIKWLTCWKDGSTFDRNVCGIMMWNKYLSRVKINTYKYFNDLPECFSEGILKNGPYLKVA